MDPGTPSISLISWMRSMAELLAFGLLVLGLFHPLEDGIGNVHARHIVLHPARGLGGGQRPDADQEERLFVQALLAHFIHEFAQQRHVVAVLGLDELRAGGNLLGDMDRRGARSGGTKGLAAAPRNTRGGVVSLRPDRNLPLSRMPRMQFSSEVESKSKTGLASGWSPACTPSPVRQQDVLHAHGGGAQHVALDGDAVPVAAGDLHDHGIAGAGQQRADADRGHVAIGAARHRSR